MRLESSLYSSRSGLTAQGQAISVVGDNISNANTTGFRRSRSEFADIVAGGKDSIASGAGVALSEVRTIHETGVIEFTGRNLDVGIGGDGFFIVNNGERDMYTRAGNFALDREGYLVDADGNQVQGYAPGTTTLGDINLLSVASGGTATTEVTLTGNLGSTSDITAIPAAPATFTELSQAANFTNVVEAVDSLGNEHSIYIEFFKTATNTWTAQAYVDGGEVGGTAGQPVQVGSPATLNFSSAGSIDDANKAAAILNVNPVAYSNGAAAGSFTVNLGGFTQYGQTSIVNSVVDNGIAAGDITGYEFSKTGEVYANLSSGQNILLGTLVLADFANLDGLERTGRSGFVQGETTGERILHTPGAGGLGKLDPGGLERSTVDIADQFVELVLFQRAYQASSQTLNAANDLLRETIALIR